MSLSLSNQPLRMGTRIEVDYWPLEDVLARQFEDNPKLHEIDKIKNSFRQHGVAKAIAVVDQGTDRMLAGHGRALALEEMRDDGEDPPKRIIKKDGTWFVPVSLGVEFDSVEQARAYLLADNKTQEEGGYDRELLGRALLATGDFETGFSEAEAKLLMKDAENEDAEEPPDEFPTFDEDIDYDYQCPKCKHKWSGEPH